MYTAEKYKALFTEPVSAEGLMHEGVNGYRVKRIRAGETLEIEAYPIWNTQRSAAEARKQQEKHRDAVRKVNLRNQEKHLRRLVNANFGAGDLLLTLTYTQDEQPADEGQARRQIRNYLRRLGRKRKKLGLEELKYIYTTECTHGILGTRYHHHLIVNGGISRETVEGLWEKGFANSRSAQPTSCGLSGWAAYMCKQKATQEKASRHGFACSRNLRKPRVSYADHKISRRMMMMISQDMAERGTEILERLYPGYQVSERPQVWGSPYVQGGYLMARMIRKGE